MAAPLMITADEVNCLIHAYFEDSGFQHSAFVLRAEGRLEQSPHIRKHIQRGELVELLSKALLYTEVEAHWRGNSMTQNCKTPFSLLERHVCSLDSTLPHSASFNPPLPHETEIAFPLTNGTAEKRKAGTPASDLAPKGKRARTEDIMEVDSAISTASQTKASTPVPATPAEPAIPPTNGKVAANQQIEPPLNDESNSITILKSHKAEVFVCAWNPSKPNLLATGSKDTIINIWDLPDPLPDGAALKVKPPSTVAHLLKEDSGDLTSLDWSSDGSLLAAGSYDTILRVCDASGQIYFSYEQHKGPIFATRFSKSCEWLLTASLDGSVCVWDIKLKRIHKQYNCHEECCLDVEWLSDNVFASCGVDQKIQVMKLDSASPFKTLSGHTNEVNQLKCNPYGTLLASCSDDGTARIWRIDDIINSSNSAPVRVLSGHSKTVSSITWRPKTTELEHEIVATSSFDGTARLWDIETGTCLHVFTDHHGPIFALSFSPDARLFATGSGDGWLHIYDVKSYAKRWSWTENAEKSGIFEIDWQQTSKINRIALAIESSDVGIIDVSRISALQ